MAERFHHVTVLQIHFCDWQQAWEQRQSLYAYHAQVEKLARKMALRRTFTHWKHCILSDTQAVHCLSQDSRSSAAREMKVMRYMGNNCQTICNSLFSVGSLKIFCLIGIVYKKSTYIFIV